MIILLGPTLHSIRSSILSQWNGLRMGVMWWCFWFSWQRGQDHAEQLGGGLFEW